MSSDSPVAILFDSAGNPIQSIEDDGLYSLGVSIAQQIKLSTLNSSKINILAGGSFTGSVEETAGAAAIQIMCISDKVLSIDIQQSSDSTNWDVVDTYLAYPGIGRGRTAKIVGEYYRVVVNNLSPSGTSYFRLTTALCPVAEALPRSLTSAGTLALSEKTTGTYPDVSNFTDVGDLPPLKIDEKGNLFIRGPILTDEKSFREDFTDGAVKVALSGTVTFSDSLYVIGSATSFLTEIKIGNYIKLDSDLESASTIVADVLSNTLLVLERNYLGTPGTGAASRANWYYQSGGSGTIGYVSSIVEMESGTTPGSHSSIFRPGDYLPLNALFVAKIDNRRANQEADIGFLDTSVLSAEKFATVRFMGTDNTKVDLVTSYDSLDKEVTSITLPNGGVTSDYHDYLLEINATSITLRIDRIRVATHFRHIVGPYDVINITAGLANFGAVGGSTKLSVDVINFSNFNKIDTSLGLQAEIDSFVNDNPAGSSVSSVASAMASTKLLDINLSRAGATIYNDSTSVLYLKLGSGASSTSFTVKMKSLDYFETPYGYTGAIYGYWASVDGYARVSEVF